MKKIIMLFLCFLTFDVYCQMWGDNNYPVKDDYENTIVLDHVVGNYFKRPLIGLAYQTEIFDDQYRFSVQGKFGYYKTLDNNLKKDNYIFVQLAPIFQINDKMSIGSYLINFQGDHPQQEFKNNQPLENIDPNYIGYSSPFSLFLRMDINSSFEKGFFSNSQVYYEINYYNYFKTVNFKITYTQKLFKTHKRN